jgi:hypothetical protein
LVVGIDLDEGLRPVAPIRVLLLNFALDIPSRYAGEAAGKCAVLLDQLIPEGENVMHAQFLTGR